MRFSALVAVIAAATPLVMAAPSDLDLRNVDCTIPVEKREVEYFCLGKRSLEMEAREIDCTIPVKREVEYFCLGKRDLGLDLREVDCTIPAEKREVEYFCLGRREAELAA